MRPHPAPWEGVSLHPSSLGSPIHMLYVFSCYFSINNPNPLDYSFSLARIISGENNNNNDKCLPQLSALPGAPAQPAPCN